MSGADHAILDLGEDELQFTSNDYKAQQIPGGSGSLTQFPPMSPNDRDTDRLIGDSDSREGTEGGGTSNFWTLAYYQQFFDVDTGDVINRLLYSMVPVPGKSFLQHHIRPRPDLYGPFWICVTLVFSIAISGNVSDFLQKSVQLGETKWHYDFHKVSLAATAVFSYASLLPAGLYGFLWWAGGAGASGAALSFLELVCLYGYSLAIYIPVSILWLIQVSWFQWICVLAGAGLSGAVLFMPIWPAVRDGASKSAVLVMVVILGLHLLLACGFMLYFFHAPPQSEAEISSTTVAAVSVAKAHEKAMGGEADVGEQKQEEGENVVDKKKAESDPKKNKTGNDSPVKNEEKRSSDGAKEKEGDAGGEKDQDEVKDNVLSDINNNKALISNSSKDI